LAPCLVPYPAPGPVPAQRPAFALGPVPSPRPAQYLPQRPAPSLAQRTAPYLAPRPALYLAQRSAPYLAPRPALSQAQRPTPYLARARPHTLPAPGPVPSPHPAPMSAPSLAPGPVLAFDHEGRPVHFDTWLDDLQLYLLSNSKDSVSLFDLVSGAAPAPPASADTEALYDVVVTRYSSPATTALGRLLLPYLFPELSAFATVEDLVSHLRASDTRYRAAVPTEFLDRNPPPMYITLYFIHLLAAETSAVAVGAAHGTPRPPFFEGCSPSPLAPSYASVAAANVSVPEDVRAASASAKRRNSKGKGGRGGGGGSGGGGGGSGSGGGGRSGGGGGRGTVGGSGGSGGGGGGSGESGDSGGGWTCGGGIGAWRVGSEGGQLQQQQRRSKTPSPQQLRLLSYLDFDAILSAMYDLSVSAEGDCYRCVPPDPGIAAAALGASEYGTLPGTAPAEALHTFTLDSDASRCFFRDSTTLTPLPAPVPIRLADPSGGLVMARFSTVLPCPTVPSGSLSGLHLPSFSTNLNLVWHHRLGHPSLPRLRGMHSRLLVSGLPRSLPPLPPSPAPPCLPYVKGRQRAAPHSSLFPPTTAPLQTFHMDMWGLAHVSGQSRERYFLLVVDDYKRYTTVFPLRSKGQVVDVLIPCIRTDRLQLRERFGQDLPVLRLHSDRGVELSSNLLRDFCRGEGIFQSFTFPDSPQQDGSVECCIGLVMEVARTSMIHAADPHFLWPFAVQYAPHQLNLWPRVSLSETSPTLRWTGEVGDASVFRVWGSRAFVRDTSADKLCPCAIPCVFLGFVPDVPGWQFYHPTSRRVFLSQDITFDKSVPFYHLFPYLFSPPPPPPLFLAPAPPPVDPLLCQNPLPGPAPNQVAVDSGATRGAASGGAASGGAEPRGAEREGAATGGAKPGGVETGDAEPGGVGTGVGEPGGAEPEGFEPGGAASKGVESGGADPQGAALSGGSAGASPRLSPQKLREWFVWRTRLRSGAGGAGTTGAGGIRVAAGAGVTGGTVTTGPGGARPRGTGAAGTGGVEGAGAEDLTESGTTGAGGVGGAGAGGAGVGGHGTGGARAGGAGAVDPAVANLPRPGSWTGEVLGTPPSAALTPPLLCPLPDQSQPLLQPASPLPAPSYTEQSGGLTERREPASRPVSPVRTARRIPRSRPPPVPDTDAMTLRPSSVPLRVPLPAPPESSPPEVPDPESDRARAASPTVSRLLAITITDPSFESAAASALVAELLDFAATCPLDYATALVAESASASPPFVGGECPLGTDVLEDTQEDFESLAAAVPRFASMLLAPEGDPDGLDIPTPRS
ncbi:unnamed protein product, partial [Closterium sp. NIES-53]